MDTRTSKFLSYSTHGWYKRLYKRLGPFELGIALAFLEKHAGADKSTFEMAVNRMFLDVPAGERPKNWTLISELLISANSGS